MSVRVVARIRPLLPKELDKDIIVHAASTDDTKPNTLIRIPSPKNGAEEFTFAFNRVYDQSASQEDLFSAEVAPHLKALFQGLDITIFAYGVTGTGKTHTMSGGMKLAERGVIPRLLSGVFRRAKKMAKDSDGQNTVSVALSYYEIYNDRVFDLMEPPEKRTPSGLPLREANGKTVVVGLSEQACEDLKDFEKLYIDANNNRVTASTKLNAHSSRSHAILRVRITQTSADGGVLESFASAIDLAGSEDNRRTDNDRQRLVESAAINKSLFVLSQCIEAISRGDRRIPFRESKMTRILSLGQNNGITIMILNLAPLRSYHLDTLSSLNVSSRAKRIEVREIENEIVYKQVPRTMTNLGAGTGTLLRQALRPLPNSHNASATLAAKDREREREKEKEKDKTVTEKAAKAFSVYTDRSKAVSAPVAAPARPANTAVKRDPVGQKRPLDDSTSMRTSKLTRPAQVGLSSKPCQLPAPAQPSISAAEIEAMVEKKVQEILASRKQPTPEPVEISAAVQKRLEALERRIDDADQDDTMAEGLRYLLMARQHKERGEYSNALTMYELALPFFPGQPKLLAKMQKLKAKMAVKKQYTYSSGVDEELPQQRSPSKKYTSRVDGDDVDNGTEADTDEVYSAGQNNKKSSQKAKMRRSALGDDVMSTGVMELLDIINSRDTKAIMGLAGIGPKKAKDLVEHLDALAEKKGERIESVAQLRAAPGMGGRTVERAYQGLVAGV